jgi:hypothetical protein
MVQCQYYLLYTLPKQSWRTKKQNQNVHDNNMTRQKQVPNYHVVCRIVEVYYYSRKLVNQNEIRVKDETN